jgi:hypothetical protein
MRAFVAGLFIAFLVLEAADPAVVAAQGGASAEIEGLRQELKRLQERLQKLEETRSQPAPSPAAPVAVQAAPPTVAPRPGEREIQLEREHPLEVLGLSKPDISGFRFSGFFSGSASFNSHIQMVPEFAGGGQALSDPRSLNFRFDKFSFGVAKTFASWLSAGAAVEVEPSGPPHPWRPDVRLPRPRRVLYRAVRGRGSRNRDRASSLQHHGRCPTRQWARAVVRAVRHPIRDRAP